MDNTKMTPEEIAWFAGLFDGEGTIAFTTKTGVTLAIAMKDEDIVRRVLALTGVGSVFFASGHGKRCDMWKWRCGKKDEVETLLHAILPWMGERRTERIHEAFQRLENNPGWNMPIEHGTYSGYRKEYRQGIPRCDLCKEAFNARMRNKRAGI